MSRALRAVMQSLKGDFRSPFFTIAGVKTRLFSMKKAIYTSLILFVFILTQTACSSFSKKGRSADYGGHAELEESAEMVMDDEAEGQGYMPTPVSDKAYSRAESRNSSRPLLSVRKKVAARQGLAARKIYYDGKVRLEVASPWETLDRLVEEVKGLGGYVESRKKSRVVLRVPVKKFTQVYQKALKMGVVLERSIEAHDITKQFQDMELRKKHLKISLDKFYSLLKSAKSSSEKIAILKEITRLKESLRYMEAALARLSKMARFSKLTVVAESGRRDIASANRHTFRAFRWIRSINPNKRKLAEKGAKLEPELPADFVEVKRKRHWEAQTSGKSSFWASKHKNKLKAGSDYWLKTMEHMLKEQYSSVERYQEGNLRGLRLENGIGSKFSYHINILATEDSLFLFESSFPTLEEEKRHVSQIHGSISQYAAKKVKDEI